MGIQTTHVWTVEPKSESESFVTEKTTLDAPPLIFHAFKAELQKVEEKNNQEMQRYFRLK